MKRIIYVSGPYSDDTHEGIWTNVLNAIKVGIEIRKKGYYPLIPHLYHDFDVVAKIRDVNFSWQDYMDMDLAFLEKCDGFYFIGPSKGACIELARAQELGLPIYYSLDDVSEAEVGE